jgi:hypothetical protein
LRQTNPFGRFRQLLGADFDAIGDLLDRNPPPSPATPTPGAALEDLQIATCRWSPGSTSNVSTANSGDRTQARSKTLP